MSEEKLPQKSNPITSAIENSLIVKPETQLLLARVELNLIKLPLWSLKPKRDTSIPESKIIELGSIRSTHGEILERSVEIIPSAKFGFPTIQAQEVLYALQLLLQSSQDKEEGIAYFSRRELITKVLGRIYSKSTRQSLELSLNQLGSTTYSFRNLLFNEKEGITYEELNNFNLISNLKLTRREKNTKVTHEKCSATINPLIISNLISGYYKPVIFSILSNLKSEIARLLYIRIDTQFSYHNHYQISSKRFFEDHSISGKDYRYPSARKRLLEKAAKELIGLPTSKTVTSKNPTTAVIASYEISKTVDGKDYKFLFKSSDTKPVEVQLPQAEKQQPKVTQTIKSPRGDLLLTLESNPS